MTEYFTGGADGVDCQSAEIILTMREKNPALKLRCFLPHEGQADRWSDSAQERYQSVLKWADSADYVSRQYYDGCMIERNHRLVESAGLLLAVFNGVRRSGTGATLTGADAPPISRADVQEGATNGSAKPRRQACSTGCGTASPGLGGELSADRAEGETPNK